VSKMILPYPEHGTGTDTPTPKIPTPAEISAALTLVSAEQVAPGVWTATLSIGLTIRIADPAAPRTNPCERCGLGNCSCTQPPQRCDCDCDCDGSEPDDCGFCSTGAHARVAVSDGR
jgi:hypothetical protein